MAVVQRSPLTRNLMLLFLGAGVLVLWLPGRELQLPSLNATFSWPLAKTPAKPKKILHPRALDTELVVDLSDRTVTVYRDRRVLTSYPVAIGQPGWETPQGSFKITQMQRYPQWQHPITKEIFPPGDGNPLGARWIGFFHDEQMILGFHGTQREDLIGSAVSHGCLRMRNRDVQALFDQVALETTVRVQS